MTATAATATVATKTHQINVNYTDTVCTQNCPYVLTYLVHTAHKSSHRSINKANRLQCVFFCLFFSTCVYTSHNNTRKQTKGGKRERERKQQQWNLHRIVFAFAAIAAAVMVVVVAVVVGLFLLCKWMQISYSYCIQNEWYIWFCKKAKRIKTHIISLIRIG